MTVALLPRELPELRSYLAAAAVSELCVPLFRAGVRLSSPNDDEDWVTAQAVECGQLDACGFNEAELIHVSPTMVELLLQARDGVAASGFMAYDLIVPAGMAYFATPLAYENPVAGLTDDIAEYNRIAAEAGVDPYVDDTSDEHRAFRDLAYVEHLLCLWQAMPSDEDHPHGYVRLSWWFEADAWWESHQAWGTVFNDDNSEFDRPRPVGLPKFVPDGQQEIGFAPAGEDVTVDWIGGGHTSSGRRPDMFRALCYLLRQRVAEQTTVHADRATRRRMAREGKTPAPIRVISLRGASASGGGDGSRDYVHRWIVRGHWRQQWYPSIQGHRPIWITPYVKGPDDAPLLGGQKVYTASASAAAFEESR